MDVLAKPRDGKVFLKAIVLILSFIFMQPLLALDILKERGKHDPYVRVRVTSKQKEVVISGVDLSRKMLISGKKRDYVGRMGVKFNCRNLTKKLKKGYRPIPLAEMSSKTGLVTLKRSKFSGKLFVLAAADRSSCEVVNRIPIENYISSLLAKEMNASWPVEALKAQAVAARTYALHKMETRQVSKELGYEAYYDLESSEKHQVGGTFFDITPNTNRATKGTKGEILLLKKNGKLTPAFFHAQCGGKTILPRNVWENKVDGYYSRPCPFCQESPRRKWNREISLKRFRDFLKWALERTPGNNTLPSKNESILLAPDHKNRLNLRVYLGERVLVLGKVTVRKYFGRKMILSNRFKAQLTKNKFKIDGKGHGHGVGMCQLGALYFAQQGWNYRKILAYYFPGHIIKKVY